MNKKNLGFISVIVSGVILIGIVSYVILSSNQTVKVWVPSETIPAGQTIEDVHLKSIDIPAKTPKGYIDNKELMVGHRMKNTVEEGQLLYQNDFLSSWESYSEDSEVPEDYVVTSIQVPDERAVGGLIVAGDTIDVLGVSDSGSIIGFDESNKSNINGRDNIGTNVYYILSNVKVLNTNSSLSEAQDAGISDVVSEDSLGEGNYYIVALSYDDFKKLRQAENILDLWLNIAPKQNDDNPPMIEQMVGQSFSGLHDAQEPVQDKDGSIIEGTPMVEDKK